MTRITWLLLVGFMISLLGLSQGIAQEITLVPGREIDGIPLESFYLSSELTNQDYFTFIQRDGYRKRYLWDYEGLQQFEKFKNAEGDYAPRTWKGSSPPMGQEYQAVFGISLFEARAYGNSKGWLVPSELMWRSAQQIKPEIGPYPWKDEGESTNAIRLIRYYPSVKLWEEKVAKLQDEITQVKRTSASISSVNATSAQMRELDRNVENLAKNVDGAVKEVRATQSQIQAVDKKCPTAEQIQKLEQTSNQIKLLQAQLNDIAQKQDSLSQQLPKLDAVINALTKLEKSFKDRESFWEGLQQNQQDLIARLSNLEKTMQASTNDVGNKIQVVEGRIQKTDNKTEQLSNQQDKVKEQLQTLESSVKTNESKLGQINTLETQTRALSDKVQKIEFLCPPMPEAISYLQFISMFKEQQLKQLQALKDEVKEKNSSVESALSKAREQTVDVLRRMTEVSSTFEELRSNINLLKQADALSQVELQNLKRQDEYLSKEDTSIRETARDTLRRLNKQENDSSELFKQSSKILTLIDEHAQKLKDGKDIDNSQSKKSEYLETDLKGVKDAVETLRKQSKTWETEVFASLLKNDTSHEKRLQDVDIDMRSLRDRIDSKTKEVSDKLVETEKKADALSKQNYQDTVDTLTTMEKKLSAKVEDVGRKTEDSTKQRYNTLADSIGTLETKLLNKLRESDSNAEDRCKKREENMQQQLKNVSKNISDNSGEMTVLKNRFETNEEYLKTVREGLQGRVKKLEDQTYQLITELQMNSNQLRNTMAEVGKRIHQLFSEGMMMGPMLGKGEVTPPQTKVPEDKDHDKKEVKIEVDKTTIARLCYALGEIYYQERSYRLAQACQKLALDFVPDFGDAKQFLEKYRKELERPETKPEQIEVAPGRPEALRVVAAQLCYYLGEIYYRNSYAKLSLDFQALALKMSPDCKEAKEFLNQHWEDLHCPPSMVYIPAGKVTLGTQDNPGRLVTPGFYMDRYEVTRKEFSEFIKNKDGYQNSENWSEAGKRWLLDQVKEFGYCPQRPSGWVEPTLEEETLPVVNINYYETEAYAKWAGKRLPTASEWEYAARGQDLRRFPWGNEAPDMSLANYAERNGIYRSISSVERFPKDVSPYGIRGMGGNISEWCLEEPTEPSEEGNADRFMPVKGGSFKKLWFKMQTFTTSYFSPTDTFEDVGFRCVKDVPANSK